MSAQAETPFLRTGLTCLAKPAALNIFRLVACALEGILLFLGGASQFGSVSPMVRWNIVRHVEYVVFLFGFRHDLHLRGDIFGALDEACIWV